jgi:hypothetical protein
VPSRRAVLGTLAVAALGGCAGSDGGSSDDTTPRETDTDTTSPVSDTTRSPSASRSETADAATGTPTASESPTGSPDLREANVVGVAVESASGGHRFDVTLIHDDDGEDGYANWWVVEALDGTELGRRELLHPHGTREFTRSTTVDLRDESCVVVRGHDQTHGYGGRAAVVAVDDGAVSFVDQGTDRRAVMAGTCP